jgi:hypothetical protein
MIKNNDCVILEYDAYDSESMALLTQQAMQQPRNTDYCRKAKIMVP